jgi:flavin-dependent dehydrogenase
MMTYIIIYEMEIGLSRKLTSLLAGQDRMPYNWSMDDSPDRRKFYIIIVGAGPAGISTALHLAQMAPELVSRTLILEKARHPRHKLCGGGILADGEMILKGLGLDLAEVPHYDVDWAHFDFDGKGMKLRCEKDGTYAFRTIQREEFDAWLAGKARERGFRIEEEVKVTGVILEEAEVRLETSKGIYWAKVVVGADGSNSVIRRAVIPIEKAHRARALELVTPLIAERSFHVQTNSYFDFWVVAERIRGYTWDFPALRNGEMVRVRGVYDANTGGREPPMTLMDALGEELRRHGLELKDYEVEGFPIRWFEPKAAISARRIVLVGDAAGTDALYGEGISLALGYGVIAAKAVREAFTTNDFFFDGYKREVMCSGMGYSLRWRTWLAKVFYRFQSTRLQRFFWRRLGGAITWVVRRVVIGWAKR